MTALLSLVALALTEIGKLVKDPLAGEAADVVNVIAGIYSAVDGAATGTITPAQGEQRIKDLLAALQSNDAAADAELAAKFSKTETP